MADNTTTGNLPEDSEQLKNQLAEMGEDVEQMSGLREQLTAQFDSVFGEDGSNLSADDISRLEELKAQIVEVDRVAEETQQAVQERDTKAAQLRNEVFGTTEKDDDKDEEGTDEGTSEGDATSTEEANPAEEGELVSASANTIATAVKAAVGETVNAFAADYLKPNTDLNKRVRLGNVAEYTPDAKIPVQRSEAVITASADIPGFTQGGRIESVNTLAKAFHARARNLPVSHLGNPEPVMIASLQREHTFNVDGSMDMDQLDKVLKAASDVDILTAAGGWCAPSEISYDFFNIVCEDGMIDLPTVGLNRGGIQYPTSPSFGDVSANPDIVWTWTEQDDIDAEESASIIKPCVRLDCPNFLDIRKDCDGFCVTAGNLVDFAYPELVENWLRLVMAIRAHSTNNRIINLMVNGGGSGDGISPSLAVDHTGLPGATTAALLNSIELTITDYREKFAMCEDSVLEIVLPRWARAVIRADLANRDGLDVFSVTDGMIADWFNIRSARVQFVGDWQVRDTGLPGDGAVDGLQNWPATLQYLAYAPGTFVRGNGMSLDLGVVRDSVLNESNDHTAAWAEDCYAITKPGHESRVVTVDICNSGEVGDRSITCAA